METDIAIQMEENPEASSSMNTWRATLDGDYNTWAYGGTPLAAAINLLGKYRWVADGNYYELKDHK